MEKKRISGGSITVFLALILSLVVSLICAGIQSVRMASARTQILNSMDIGLYSLFGQYDKTLLEDYDLFAVDASDGNGGLDLAAVCDDMEAYIKPVLSQNGGNLELKQSGLNGYVLLTDEKGTPFYSQIVSYMKETLGIHGVQLLLDKMTERKDETQKAEARGNQAENGNTLESYESEMSDAAKKSEEAVRAAQQAEQQAAQENSQGADAFGDGSQENNAGSASGGAEKKAVVVQAENPIPAIRRIRGMGILSLVLPTGKEVSEKKISKGELVSGRSLLSGMAMSAGTSADSSVTGQVLYQQYLMEKLGNYQDVRDGGLDYQIEYILCGKDSDEANLKAIAGKLLLVREGVNAACLAADSGKRAQAAALAAAIAAGFLIPPAAGVIEAALILCWSFGESILDVRELFAGGKVPLVKSGADWQLSLENLPGLLGRLDTDRKESANGLSYEDYLQVFLLAAGKETKVMRGMDMVENTLRTKEGLQTFRMDNCITSLEASMDAEAYGKKTFSVKREYSYI